MTGHAVVIAGGGPTGLTLAAELALAGIDVAIVERRPDQNFAGSRALGLHARSIEMFELRGIADRFLSRGQVMQVAGFAWIPLDIGDLPARHAHGLALGQTDIEEILAEWADELKVPMYRSTEVVGLSQDHKGVQVSLSNGSSLQAQYLVGCDGGRSIVRKAAGIAFPGWEATVSHLIAEVQMTETPPPGLHRDVHGIHSLVQKEDGSTVRVLLTEAAPGAMEEPTLQDLSERLFAVYGSDFGAHSPTWISRFTDMARQAETYRKGRVLVAGDAAHVHYPTGGQGINTGIQDAMNLGWKLAQVVKGVSPDSLLDTYHDERHPVAAAMLQNTLAQVALLRMDDRTEALRAMMGEILAMDEPRRALGAKMSGLYIRYDLGEGHPLLGRAMPDVEIERAVGQQHVSTLLHDARPVFLQLGDMEGIDLSPWLGRVQHVRARYHGAWVLPVVGPVDAPCALLIRPDGYVAWVGSGTNAGLQDALTTWFGQPSRAAAGRA
jgi:3-(3-hydroxy-phenyl)propionate hydroxylase